MQVSSGSRGHRALFERPEADGAQHELADVDGREAAADPGKHPYRYSAFPQVRASRTACDHRRVRIEACADRPHPPGRPDPPSTVLPLGGVGGEQDRAWLQEPWAQQIGGPGHFPTSIGIRREAARRPHMVGSSSGGTVKSSVIRPSVVTPIPLAYSGRFTGHNMGIRNPEAAIAEKSIVWTSISIELAGS